MEFIKNKLTSVQYTPDMKGCSYLYLFEKEYHKEIFNKLKKFPKAGDIINALPYEKTKDSKLRYTKSEIYNKYFIKYRINRRVVHADKIIFLEPTEYQDRSEREIEMTKDFERVKNEIASYDVDHEKVNDPYEFFVYVVFCDEKHSIGDYIIQ